MSPKHHPSSTVSLNLATEKARGDLVSPILATFPDVLPQRSTTRFSLYAHPSNDRLPQLLIGENQDLQFRSDISQSNPANCTYMLGLHLPQSGSLTLYPTRFHHLRPVVKRLAETHHTLPSQSSTDHYAARTSLGTTFGTKKARRAIQAAARNRVDPGTMSHLENQISSTITQSSSCLPSAQVLADEIDAARPIPPFNKQATDPSQVYSLSSIVSSTELNSIPLEPIFNAPSLRAAYQLLPFSASRFIQSRLAIVWHRLSQAKLDKVERKRLRLLVYINCLMTIAPLRNLSRDRISHKLSCGLCRTIPDSIVEGILTRFTETAQGADGLSQHQMTSFSNLKLLSYLAALCLIHDEFQTRLSGLAEDLYLPPTRLNTIFQSLGCRLIKLSNSEIEDLDGSEEKPMMTTTTTPAVEEKGDDPKQPLATQRTVAKLVVPLVFPSAKVRRRRN